MKQQEGVARRWTERMWEAAGWGHLERWLGLWKGPAIRGFRMGNQGWALGDLEQGEQGYELLGGGLGLSSWAPFVPLKRRWHKSHLVQHPQTGVRDRRAQVRTGGSVLRQSVRWWMPPRTLAETPTCLGEMGKA